MNRKSKLFLLVAFLLAVVPDWIIYLVATHFLNSGERQEAHTVLIFALSALSVILFIGLAAYLFLIQNNRYSKLKQTKDALSEKEAQLSELNRETVNLKSIVQALSDNYDCIYLVNMETNRFKIVYEADRYHNNFNCETSADDFFEEAEKNIERLAEPQDRDYILNAYRKETIIEKLNKINPYVISYRLIVDGNPEYYQAKLTRNRPYQNFLVIGILCVNEQMQYEREQRAKLENAFLKERIFKKVLLTNAVGYFEVNLTQNLITSKIFNYRKNEATANISKLPDSLSYDELRTWWCGREACPASKSCRENTNRTNLINRFYNEENIIENVCSKITRSGVSTEYLQTYYITQEESSGDIVAICTFHDKTEQRKRERQVKRLEAELKESRIKNFESQIQPHFLYNALGSIREIILRDPMYASDLIYDFTTHLRACIKSMSSNDVIPFFKELENINAYVHIEQMRFRDKLHMEYSIEVDDFPIIPLTIQPIVENAIRHGIYERGLEGGTVTIRTRETDSHWIVQVVDDGVGFDIEKTNATISSGEKDSTGLNNLVFRLEQKLNAKVEIKSEIDTGTCVTVRIPKGGITGESDRSG